MEDDAYLQTLAQFLPDLLSNLQPDLVLYDAGVDPMRRSLGKISPNRHWHIPPEMQVLSTCVGGYPVACVIGVVMLITSSHLSTGTLIHRAASEVYRHYRL